VAEDYPIRPLNVDVHTAACAGVNPTSFGFLPRMTWYGRCGYNGQCVHAQSRTSWRTNPEQSKHISFVAAVKLPASALAMVGRAILGKRFRIASKDGLKPIIFWRRGVGLPRAAFAVSIESTGYPFWVEIP